MLTIPNIHTNHSIKFKRSKRSDIKAPMCLCINITGYMRGIFEKIISNNALALQLSLPGSFDVGSESIMEELAFSEQCQNIFQFGKKLEINIV